MVATSSQVGNNSFNSVLKKLKQVNNLSHYEQNGNQFMTFHSRKSHQFVILFSEQLYISKGLLRAFWRKVILKSCQNLQECNLKKM